MCTKTPLKMPPDASNTPPDESSSRVLLQGPVPVQLRGAGLAGARCQGRRRAGLAADRRRLGRLHRLPRAPGVLGPCIPYACSVRALLQPSIRKNFTLEGCLRGQDPLLDAVSQLSSGHGFLAPLSSLDYVVSGRWCVLAACCEVLALNMVRGCQSPITFAPLDSAKCRVHRTESMTSLRR